MPSVVDKASQISLHRKRSAFKKSYHSGKEYLAKFCYQFNFPSITPAHRLVYQRSDMPRSGQNKQAIVTRNKRSSESPEPTEHRHPRPVLISFLPFSHEEAHADFIFQKQSSGGPNRSQARKDQESGQGHRGSPASKSGQANPSAPSRRLKVAKDCTNLLSVPLPISGGKTAADSKELDVKPTNTSAAYLDYCISKEVKRRKQNLVDNLMAVIAECVEKRLEALEEECDQSSGSRSSSSAVQTGKPIYRSAGQKRSKDNSSQDESENDEDEDEGNSKRKRDNKRTKTTKDDTRPRFACPYHQYDPVRFGSERTCCGPGWIDISRLKEHLERRHALASHQCLRCLRRFSEAEALRKHQREKKPCSVKESDSFKRNLSDGYDEEQAKKLKGRPRMLPTAKWREWYSILFNIKPDSPEIPSPYYDSSRPGAKVPCMKLDDVEHWREYWDQAKPAVRHHVTKTVNEAFGDFEPQIKSEVMQRLQELPRIIAELLPFPGLNSEETSSATDTIGLFDCFSSLDPNVYNGEDFDFSVLDNGIHIQNQLQLGFTDSSDSSDTYLAGDSSGTSVGDGTAYQQVDFKPTMQTQNVDYNLFSTQFY
ncbi:hypothetical protein FLAG1_00505 [Fusarium langsethiae]|uniref:C2H2-type domain-containing protein n=1 Tax=Fusarium langsethiae TaxID=179993 RepID=A0A0M9F5X3_FUSLA|nr:hypothetical protein FLAG1_00505 [Fusarium langsethiae]GKT98394.1 unnamed protein product [Fusarium langsethiae]